MTASRFLGLISGTSADGIDAALVDINSDGTVDTVAFATFPYPEELRRSIIEAAHAPESMSYTRVASLDQQVGLVFADVAKQMLERSETSVTAIGSHGQTLFHSPQVKPAYTVQIGDPNRIAYATRLPVVADIRRMDMAAGGQGAPLASALHERALADSEEPRAVLNLGGIANLTLLPLRGGDVIGFDTGPASCLMDHWSASVRGISIDENGRWAASGSVDEDLLAAFLDEPYFDQKPPKSTGREYFSAAWLQRFLGGRECAPEDVQATLCELTACTVAQALVRHQPGCRRLLVCGGGVHNKELIRRLRNRLKSLVVESTSVHGLDPDAVEATLVAWLAWARINKVAGNLATVTGAGRRALLGAIYDGRNV